MIDCNVELAQKIQEHRRKGMMCSPDCWCWSAVGTISLYESAIEANKLASLKLGLVNAQVAKLLNGRGKKAI